MDITKSQNGIDILNNDEISIVQDIEVEPEPFKIGADKRINIGYAEEATDYLWRFFIQGESKTSLKI